MLVSTKTPPPSPFQTSTCLSFDAPLPQAVLNIKEKNRSNLFTWRGQFSPQLIEALFVAYAPRNGYVLDPFVGSGTVLYEAGQLGLSALGLEVNPAAATLAQTYQFMNIRQEERIEHLTFVERTLQRYLQAPLPLFQDQQATLSDQALKDSVLEALRQTESLWARRLFETLVVMLDFWRQGIDKPRVWNTWSNLRSLVEELPETDQPICVKLADARRIPLKDESVDFVVTSPPYINVFNYHQNYRASMEALGWDLLKVAKSEIGSNRKFRQNRFLTVVQYCIDIAGVLVELRRVSKPQARLILIVGHESNVRKTPFFNSTIVSELAQRIAGFKVMQTQQRTFLNKFGKHIREDLLHLAPAEVPARCDLRKVAHSVAHEALVKAYTSAPEESKSDLKSAIERVDGIHGSPIFDFNSSSPEMTTALTE